MAVLAFSGVLVCSVQAGGRERGRPIEFSAPKSDEVTTNLHQLTSKKDGLKQLEEELYQPLQSFAPKSSLEGVAARPYRPPARSATENKRVKDLLERRKNWVFMDPDSMNGTPTLEEILKTPEYGSDGREKKDMPAMEGFYQRMSKKPSTADTPPPDERDGLFGSSAKTGDRQDASAREDASLPSGIRETAERLQGFYRPSETDDPLGRVATRPTLEDMFGLASKEPSAEDLKAHKKFLADYQAEVDPSWKSLVPVVPENPFANLMNLPAASATKPSVGLPTVASTVPRTAMEAQADIVNPRLGPAPMPDLNAKALGLSREADTLPKIETTRVAPPTPSFEVPKRSFR